MREKCITVAGRPASGKSTYLAALYYFLKRPVSADGWSLLKLPGDLKYLNTLASKWEKFEEVGHTAFGTLEAITLDLKSDRGQEVSLTYPDLSGEEFNVQWARRSFSPVIEADLSVSPLVLFFVGPKIVDSILISDLVGTTPDRGADIARAEVFNVADAPDDVILVELLQFLQSKAAERLRVAVIFSAWDEVKTAWSEYSEEAPKPGDWLAKRLPLFNQFLSTRHESMATRIYGISAFGGNPKTDRPKLQMVTDHSQRVSVVEPDGTEHKDLRAPLDWLISGN